MNIHKNARTNQYSRLLLVRRASTQRWSVADAANAAGISKRTAFKWLARYKAGGEAGLLDRSHAPHRVRRKLSDRTIEEIKQLRLQRLTGPAIARRSTCPDRPSGPSCAGSASASSRRSKKSRQCGATSANGPAN